MKERAVLPVATLVLACLAGSGRAAPPPGLELIEVKKIGDAAPHNAFTDLIRFRDAWYCVFREGSGHIPGKDGVIRVLRSDDGAAWASAAMLATPGLDLRDPKISVTPDGRLMLLMGGSTYAGDDDAKPKKFVTARTHVAFSADGATWTAPRPVSVEGSWLWRVTWHEGVGYGFAYTFQVPAREVKLSLWRTTDGVSYERIAAPELPEPCWPDETTIRFRPDGTMLALARNERPPHPAYLGTSRPPYTEWTWADTGQPAQGPSFVILPDGDLLYGGRAFPDGPKTVLGRIDEKGKSTPLVTLPSGGDTSYPGMVLHDGQLWVSYYASHEGKAAIYLARLRVTR